VNQLISFGFQKKKKYPEKKPMVLSESSLSCYASPFFLVETMTSQNVNEPRANHYFIGMRRVVFYKSNRNKTSKTGEIDMFRRLRCRVAGG